MEIVFLNTVFSVYIRDIVCLVLMDDIGSLREAHQSVSCPIGYSVYRESDMWMLRWFWVQITYFFYIWREEGH